MLADDVAQEATLDPQIGGDTLSLFSIKVTTTEPSRSMLARLMCTATNNPHEPPAVASPIRSII